MKHTAIVLLGIVSAIFVAKYSVRLGAHGILFGAMYFVAFVGIAISAAQVADRLRTPLSGRLLALATGGLAVLALIAVLILPPASRVGRLPAIEVWLSDLLAGAFPYHAPNQPSGFPILFLLAFPAYALGNAGFLEVVAIALFGAALSKRDRMETRGAWLPFIVLLILPSIYYEVIVRSELFFNMTLVLALIVFTDEYLAGQKVDWKFVGRAFLFGLVLSTRSIVGLVYVTYALWRFRHEPLPGVLFSLVVVLTFLLTLAPFIVWNPALFYSNGPFSIQFGYLPLWIVLLFIAAAIVAGLAVRELEEVLFASGVLLFAIVFAAFLLRVNEAGFGATLYMDRFDISYFVFCTPFLLYSLHERRM